MAIATSVPVLQESEGGIIEEEERIYVAVGKDFKDGESTLLWALHHFVGKKICILHVHQPSQTIPLLGGKYPAKQFKEEEVSGYRDMERQKMQKLLNEYIFICAQVGVRAEKLYIEMENIGKGIVELVARHGIRRLIMGAAAGMHKKMTTIKSKKAIFVNQQAHISCHIWFVFKGFLIQTRESHLDEMDIVIKESALASSICGTPQQDHLKSTSTREGDSDRVRHTNPVRSFIHRVRSHGRRVATVTSLERKRDILMHQSQLGGEESGNQWETNSRECLPKGPGLLTWSSSEEVVQTSESISLMRHERNEEEAVLSLIHEAEEDVCCSSLRNELGELVDHEMFNKLGQAKREAANAKREAFEELLKRRKAEKDAIEAIRKANLSESLYAREVERRKEMEVELARGTLELNKIKRQLDEFMEELKTSRDQKVVLECQIADSAQTIKELEEKIVVAVGLLVTFKEDRDRLQVERDNAVGKAGELGNRREEIVTSSPRQQLLSEFSFSEIDAATSNFDPGMVIREGEFGSIYKGFLRNTEVAIKLLNSSSLQGSLEFQHEVDVLSKVRHPNVQTLIGACPDALSLIYEYLPNGSLADRLACNDNTPPLSWQIRIRIAVDICSAIIFLHSCKPRAIVHGNLNPTNIFLDANFTSKLSGFGMSQSLSGDELSTNKITECCTTDITEETPLYTDPEFLSTGELTPNSDVYSYGIVLLQLLTGRPAVDIAEVQCALDEGFLGDLLDPTAGNWPFVQAKQLAHISLRCCEAKSENRLDLISEVWRVLEPMKTACEDSTSFRLGSEETSRVPSHFMCPIFQEIMSDPQVAADGFTYEAEAIKGWLDSGHNTSPMTNLKLTHNDLIPNHSLRSAIEEWRQQH